MVSCYCSNRSQYERNTSFRHLVNANNWYVNVAKLQPVGLRLNASKAESLLESKWDPSVAFAFGTVYDQSLASVCCNKLMSSTMAMVNALETTYVD